MGLPQNETNLFSLLFSPAKHSIFPVHKVKWHFPPSALYAMSSTPRDASWPWCVCVCSEKETSESRSKHRVIHISTLYCLSGLLLWEDSCFESVSGENIWAKGILDLKHGCFVSIWTDRPRQTDWKWQGNYSLWIAVFCALKAFHILTSYICAIENNEWCDFSK